MEKRKIYKINRKSCKSNPPLGISVLLLFMSFFEFGFSQQLTVETCQEKAKTNYPLVKQFELIEQTTQYNINNANKGYLPQLAFSAKTTYQSDVTQIPSSLSTVLSGLTGKPFSFPAMEKMQYQAVLEASQLIWDGGLIASQKKITNAGSQVEKQKLEVDLYSLNERVNQLFFGILLLNEQMKQNEILQNELQTNYDRIKAYMLNGVANQSDMDILMVEQLNVNQRQTDLENTQKSYCLVLAALTGLKIDEKTELKKPEIDFAILNNNTNNRPELSLFDARNKIYEGQIALLNAGNLPKIGAFVQGGFGLPGLNMFSNNFSPFYIGGLRLSWNISGFYSQKNNLNKIEISKKTVNIQKETFLFNSNLKTKQQKTEIEKLQSTLLTDDEIIRLRENIKKSAAAKVDNGTLTMTDLIREINAENQAKQLKSFHEIQLIMSVYQLKNNINN